MVSEVHINVRVIAQAQIAALEDKCERIEQTIFGRQMVWRRVGQGPPLVLLHGGHGCWLHWARVIPELSLTYSLWIPDMPGYGESTLTPLGGIDDLVTQLQKGLDALMGEQTNIRIAGFSFGGLVSSQLAIRRGHVERMVLVGPAGHGGQRRQAKLPLPWRDLEPDRNLDQWTHRLRHNLLAQMLHSESSIDPLAMEIHWRGCQSTRFHSKPFSRSSALHTALSSYPGEVTTIWAEHDVTATPQEMAADMSPSGAVRKRVIVNGSGHWVMHECPATTTKLMKSAFSDY